MNSQILAPHDLSLAARLLQEGFPVAIPTETVYGLAAPLYNPVTIAKVFALKGRPSDNPLIAHICSLDQLHEMVVDLPEDLFILAEHFFPGPLTLVLKKHPSVPSIVSGGGGTLAFRMPSHPLTQKLIALTGPLVAPSANLSGRPSPTSPSHVLEDFEGKIKAVLDGGVCSIGIESTVLSLLDPGQPLLLRPGAITQEALEEVLGKTIALPQGSTPLLSPGMKYRHYAPKAKVHLFESQEALDSHSAERATKRKIATPTAATLYEILRSADREGCEEVCLLCTHEVRSHRGLMNRLLLASSMT